MVGDHRVHNRLNCLIRRAFRHLCLKLINHCCAHRIPRFFQCFFRNFIGKRKQHLIKLLAHLAAFHRSECAPKRSKLLCKLLESTRDFIGSIRQQPCATIKFRYTLFHFVNPIHRLHDAFDICGYTFSIGFSCVVEAVRTFIKLGSSIVELPDRIDQRFNILNTR